MQLKERDNVSEVRKLPIEISKYVTKIVMVIVTKRSKLPKNLSKGY
jgi:hypothetical protein